MDIDHTTGFNHMIRNREKVRITALGCGYRLAESLMTQGASDWLHSINILYAKEATEAQCVDNTSKFVSPNRLVDLMENLTQEDNVIDITVTASMSYSGQRKGRENKALILIRWWCGVWQDEYAYEEVIFDPDTTRDEQEIEIVEAITKIIRSKTQVIFAGSFNPIHDGHVEVLDKLLSKTPYNKVDVQLSSNHPVKGLIDRDELTKRVDFINEKLHNKDGIDITINSHPLYKDKYHAIKRERYNTPYRKTYNVVFVVGSDIWDSYKDEFEKDFEDRNDVSFLVFNRYENKDREIDSRLLHRLSFKFNMQNLNINSTNIRNDI